MKPKGFITVIKIMVTRDATSYNLVNEYQFSKKSAVSISSTLKMEAADSFETFVSVYKTFQKNVILIITAVRIFKSHRVNNITIGPLCTPCERTILIYSFYFFCSSEYLLCRLCRILLRTLERPWHSSDR
jgi:hypothetical protein